MAREWLLRLRFRWIIFLLPRLDKWRGCHAHSRHQNCNGLSLPAFHVRMRCGRDMPKSSRAGVEGIYSSPSDECPFASRAASALREDVWYRNHGSKKEKESLPVTSCGSKARHFGQAPEQDLHRVLCFRCLQITSQLEVTSARHRCIVGTAVFGCVPLLKPVGRAATDCDKCSSVTESLPDN